MKKKLVLAFTFALLSSFSLFSKTNTFALETETRTERVFENTVSFCYFLYAKNVESGLMNEEELADKCDSSVETPSFFYDGGEIRVPDDEIWILNNVNMELGYVSSRFVVEKGKLIIDGEDTLINKYDGCFIIVNPGITKDNLEIRAGTFMSGNGTAAPICYETQTSPDGTLTRESLGDIKDALKVIMSYIPEDSIYLNLSSEPNEELTELIPTTKWMHKTEPSWFYVFNSWKFKIVKRPETPEPTPEKPTTEEPEPEPAPEPSSEEPTNGSGEAEKVKPASKDSFSAPRTPDTSLISDQLVSASDETAPEKSPESARISYQIPIITISVVIYTLLSIIGNRERLKERSK